MTMWDHNHKCDWSSSCSSWPDNIGDDENRNDTVGVVVVVIVGERPWSYVASEVLVVVVTAARMMIDCREQSLRRWCCIWYVPFINK